MKRKMRRLLAMLLAFILTFTVASTDVLAAGLEMAGEESVATVQEVVAEDVVAVTTGVEATAENAELSETEGTDTGKGDRAEAKAMADGEDLDGAKATIDADGEDLDGAKATVDADGEGIADAKDAAGAVGEDLVGASAGDANGAEANADDADEADAGADDEGGADAGAADADGADAGADAVNEEDGAETEDGAEAEDAAEMAEDEDETLAEVGGSPRLRSFGAPRSLSLSNTGFSEGFEGDGIPVGWTLETDTEGYNWALTEADPHSGSKAAISSFTSGDGQTAWLITPAFDFSGVTGILKLSFWYRNSSWNGLFEELSVCWRVDGGEWQELFKTESAHDNWTKQIVLLPDGAKKADLEIGFKCTNHDALGIYLDDVLFEIVDSSQYYAVTYNANGGTGTMMDAGSPYLIGLDVTILPNGFTRSKNYFTCWNTKADGSGTTYYPGDVFEITGNVTLYAQWADASSGLNESFEATGLPAGWTVIADDEENQWLVGMDDKYGLTAHSGDQMAFINSFNSTHDGTVWMITPALDLSGAGKDWLLSFWYQNPVYSTSRFSLETYYRVNGGEWKVLSKISSANNDWTEEVILLPEEARTTNVEIGFKALESYSHGIYLDDVVLQRSTTDYYRISVSDAMIGGSVKADKSYAVAGETITLNVTPDGFSEFKTLTVKKGSTAIATTKVDETTYTFVMPAGNVTLEATFQMMKGIVFYEDFEDGGELPGWILTDADGDGNNWFIYAIEAERDANGNDMAHSGSHVLTSASYDNNNGLLTPDNWAMTPVITIPANAQLSFWIRGQDPNYPNEKMAVYVGTGTSVEGMTKVGGDYTATDMLENYVVDLGAYAGQSIRIAFRHYNITDLYRLNLDDVFVTGRSGDATIGTLTYNANGGSGETTDSKNPYILGRMATVLPCGFTAPAGMEFMGWNTEADGSGTTYAPGDAILMDGDKTLYAMWVNPADLIAYLEEGFESGAIPEGWSLENEDDGYSWAINQRGTRVGNYSANANWSSVETKGKSSWLITPAINLSGVKGPACLSFMLVNDDYYGKVDEFGVYYRIGSGAWQVLFYTSEAHDGYSPDPEIYLPNEVKVANVQFAFRAIDRSGKGVSLDEVLLTGVKEVKAYYAVTYNANGGSGETVDLSSPYQKNDTATVMPNLFTAPEGKKFDSWNTKADGTGTTYYPAQTLTITGAVTLYARWQDVSPMPTELDEGFEGGVIPEEWTMESDSESYRWTVGTGDYQLTPGAHSGGKNALIRHATNDSTAWLITPALDLRGEKDCLLSFWYLNRKWGTDTDAFKVCYRVAGGAWTELFYTQEPHGTWTEKILRVPKEARAEGVEFGFWALDKYGRGVGLDDVQVKVYDHPVSLLTIEDSTNGTMTADATGIRNAGDAVTLTVTPNEGYQLAEIQLTDGSECPAIKKDTSVKYLFTMPEGDVTMEAKFYAEGATYSYNLYVGGSQITTDNDLDVLGNGEVSYDGITKVLTFKKDVTHTYGDAVSSNINGLIIKTITEVTITSGADDAMQLNGQTVIETGNLLTLKGAADKGGYGIYARANVTIRNSKMNVFGKWGLYSSSGKVITIENSVVTAQGPYGAVNGIDLVDCDVVAPVGGTFSEGGLIRESSWSIAEKATVSPVIEVTADNPYFEGFEGHSIPRDWTFIDADGDGRGWSRYSVGNAVLHSGDVALTSYSYLEYVDQPLTPDNWAYLPALKIPEHAELSFWLAAQSEIWAGDVLGVFVGTTLNPEDMTQLGEDFVSTAECVEHKLDLSAYAGQTVFIAFRHYNCTDHYQLNLDDVTVKVDESALTDNNLVIAKKSLTLQDTIAIDFKIAKSAIEGKYQDPYLVVTQNGEESIITKWEPNDDGTLMIFSYRVAPHNMRDVVTAVPHALNANGEDVTGVSVDYSVTDYCYNMLGKDTYQTDDWAPFRRLLVDILLYGDAAQKFTGYKTTELPSWKLTSAQRAMGTDVTVPMSYSNVKDVNFETVNASDEKAKIVTAALYLEASVNIQFKFTADDLTGLKVVVTDGENVLETLTPDPSKKDSNGRYYVTFGKLNAGQMRKTVYATVMQGTKKVSNTMQYSIESYAAAQSNSTVPNLPGLLHAMMRYGDSAKAVAEMLGQ